MRKRKMAEEILPFFLWHNAVQCRLGNKRSTNCYGHAGRLTCVKAPPQCRGMIASSRLNAGLPGEECNMELWKQLLSDDVGRLSIIVITVTTIIVGVCISYFIKKAKSRDDQQ